MLSSRFTSAYSHGVLVVLRGLDGAAALALARDCANRAPARSGFGRECHTGSRHRECKLCRFMFSYFISFQSISLLDSLPVYAMHAHPPERQRMRQHTRIPGHMDPTLRMYPAIPCDEGTPRRIHAGCAEHMDYFRCIEDIQAPLSR